MASGDYGRYDREMMNDRNRSYRRPNRDDWTTDDLGYGEEGYRYGRGSAPNGAYPYGLYSAYMPFGTDERHRSSRDYDRFHGDDRRRGERDMWDRAGDEIASWFGDEDAERRREMDARRDESLRGRGPKGYLRSDSRINEDVHDRLTDHPRLDASDVTVTVQDGEVTLNGFVRRRGDKRVAEDCAETVTGVKNVQNNLRVKDQDQV
ncbi:Osmotically-inducible protein OsmY, contains BON domain [Ensifer adhaerens]|nr:Osmotically-inducible protein OsmY, contains BON domain [Ensifer adhaerens]